MHKDPSVVLGCTDCHGGDPSVFSDKPLDLADPGYIALKQRV